MPNKLLNDEYAILKDNEFINKRTKSIPVPQTVSAEDLSIVNRIAENGLSSNIDMSAINAFTQVSNNRNQIYALIDEMSNDPTIAAILETYAEDATEYNDKGQIIWVQAEDSKINSYITWLIDTMQFDKHMYKWVHSLCKYGDIYFQLFRKSEYDIDPFFDKKEKIDKQLNEDVKINAYSKNDKYVHYIESIPNPAEMFELIRFGKTAGYVKTDVKALLSTQQQPALSSMLNQYRFKKNDVNLYGNDKFVHATLEDNSSRNPEIVELFLNDKDYSDNKGTTYTVKRGQSLLYNVFKIWRELSLLENSMLLNRITKSAIVRLINVEVGDMPKENVGPHLQGIKALMEQKSAINTGNSMTEYTNPGPIENNIYVPTYNGKGAITADQIGGDINVGQLPDIEYFQNKFFGAMRVPKQFFGLTDDGAGFNGGQSLAIISSRYAKMIKRIQNSIIQALTDVINLMLIDKGLDSYVNQFTLCMQPPTTQEEIDRRDNLSSKVGIVGDIMNLLSDIEDPVIKTKILKSLISTVITDDEVITLIDEQIKALEDQESSLEGSTGEGEEFASSDFGGSDLGGDEFGENEPLDLDSSLGLEPELGAEGEESEEALPTPEE